MRKVLIIGDLHGNAAHATALLRVAARHDCRKVFALGDFGAWEHTRPGRRYLDTVDRTAGRLGLTVYFLDGNHDKSALLLERYGEHRDEAGFLMCRKRIRYAPRGHRWTWEGTRFAAFGGAYSVDKQWRLDTEARQAGPAAAQSLWFPEEEMTDAELDALLAADATVVDVLLTHDKPRAAQPEHNRKSHPECLPNQDRIQRVVQTLRPTVLLHGHLHFRYTDTIACGADAWTRVEGLDADPGAAWRTGYDRRDSWLILDLPVTRDLPVTGDPVGA